MENFIFLYSDEDININVINITHMQIRRCEKISSNNLHVRRYMCENLWYKREISVVNFVLNTLIFIRRWKCPPLCLKVPVKSDKQRSSKCSDVF